MEAFTRFTGLAAPLDMSNVDTDKLLPNRFFRKARGNGLQQYMLHDIRFNGDGSEKPDFILNRPAYREARILVAGPNFGSGSAREGAVYAVADYGIRAIIAPSFSDIYAGNMLQNGLLPVVLPQETCDDLRAQLHAKPGAEITIDLEAKTVTGPDGKVHAFDIDASPRERLLKGQDDIDLILVHQAAIEAFEQRYLEQHPWRRAAVQGTPA
ncbi:3-isopropylmalate dehydratase small subunit [Caenimonas aquaedulcis]|uniref:3-isopropylmalate dehydratase small subunit n=1 Tax=Caenimonas aquaedulcis TaxID=2793270 RepID=A0A931MDS9_9BURK|nr:3-isopropylmalate dehydratase small subunit [Caenimonas aquaedulcis]MBG9386402.1 3-isopropylmalate dehydratase small subunit [Caenimonas aquaedulcis]